MSLWYLLFTLGDLFLPASSKWVTGTIKRRPVLCYLYSNAVVVIAKDKKVLTKPNRPAHFSSRDTPVQEICSKLSLRLLIHQSSSPSVYNYRERFHYGTNLSFTFSLLCRSRVRVRSFPCVVHQCMSMYQDLEKSLMPGIQVLTTETSIYLTIHA